MLRRLPRFERPHRLDFVGALLVMAASSTFMLALNLGGVRYSWLSLPVLSLLGCALVLGAGFVARLRTAAEPLIPIGILSDPAARAYHCRAFVRLGRNGEPQRLSADVSAKRARLVADGGGLKPDDPDGDAQYQRGIVEPASRPGAALQAPAVVLSPRRHRRGRRARILCRQHDVTEIRDHLVPDRRRLGADGAVDASWRCKTPCPATISARRSAP